MPESNTLFLSKNTIMKKILSLFMGGICFFELYGAHHILTDIYTIDDKVFVEYDALLIALYPFLKNDLKSLSGEYQVLYWFIRQLVYLASNNVSMNEIFPDLVSKGKYKTNIVDIASVYNFFLIFFQKNQQTKSISFDAYSKYAHSKFSKYFTEDDDGGRRPNYINILNLLYLECQRESYGEIIIENEYLEKIPFFKSIKLNSWHEEFCEQLGKNDTVNREKFGGVCYREHISALLKNLRNREELQINVTLDDVKFSKSLETMYPFLANDKTTIKNQSGEYQVLYWFIRQLIHLASIKVSLKDLCRIFNLEKYQIVTFENIFLLLFVHLYGNNEIMFNIPYEKYTKNTQETSDFLSHAKNNSQFIVSLNYEKIFNLLSATSVQCPRYLQNMKFIVGDEFEAWRSEFESMSQLNRQIVTAGIFVIVAIGILYITMKNIKHIVKKRYQYQ